MGEDFLRRPVVGRLGGTPPHEIIGLFDTQEEADRAIHALEDAGFDRGGYSILTGGNRVYAEDVEAEETDPSVAEGAGKGAIGGGVVGGIAGLLIGVGAIVIPGIGPVIAAGSVATALAAAAAGAGAGAAAGGLIGALVDRGVPEDEAQTYAAGLEQGGVLVIVSAEGQQRHIAMNILRVAGAKNLSALDEERQSTDLRGLQNERPDSW